MIAPAAHLLAQRRGMFPEIAMRGGIFEKKSPGDASARAAAAIEQISAIPNRRGRQDQIALA